MDIQELDRMWKLMEILRPYSFRKYQEIVSIKKKMAHYTTAESLVKILQNKTRWMRNTSCMSDYREVQHGYELMLRYFQEIHRE